MVSKPNILVFDLDSRSESGVELEELLRKGGSDALKIRRECISDLRTATVLARLRQTFKAALPAVIFIILSDGLQDDIAELFKALRTIGPMIPMIAVLDERSAFPAAQI